jgi:hypothetical protein
MKVLLSTITILSFTFGSTAFGTETTIGGTHGDISQGITKGGKCGGSYGDKPISTPTSS